jgi:hypothetical protein
MTVSWECVISMHLADMTCHADSLASSGASSGGQPYSTCFLVPLCSCTPAFAAVRLTLTCHLWYMVSKQSEATATACRATFDTDNIDIGPERRAYLDHRLSRAWEVNSQVCMCYLGTPIPLASVPCTSQMCMTWLYGYTHLLLPEATASKSQSSPACHTISPAALYYAHLLILLLVALSHLNVAVSAALCHASCIC